MIRLAGQPTRQSVEQCDRHEFQDQVYLSIASIAAPLSRSTLATASCPRDAAAPQPVLVLNLKMFAQDCFSPLC